MENNYIIIDGQLYHHGVKGMKWGRRKARPVATGTGRRGAQPTSSSSDQTAAKQARKAKAKKALMIGAAVAGTALATVGIYKLVKARKSKQAENAKKAVERMLESDAAFKRYLEQENKKQLAAMPGVISRTYTTNVTPSGDLLKFNYKR